MDTSDLTRDQAQRLEARLSPMLGYVVRLSDRMQKRGWRANDPTYLAVWNARDALHEMCVRLRYQAIGNPGSRAPTPPPRGAG